MRGNLASRTRSRRHREIDRGGPNPIPENFVRGTILPYARRAKQKKVGGESMSIETAVRRISNYTTSVRVSQLRTHRSGDRNEYEIWSSGGCRSIEIAAIVAEIEFQLVISIRVLRPLLRKKKQINNEILKSLFCIISRLRPDDDAAAIALLGWRPKVFFQPEKHTHGMVSTITSRRK